MIMKKILFSLLVVFAPLLSFAQSANDTIGLFAVHDGKYEQMDKIMYRKIKGSGSLGATLSMGLAARLTALHSYNVAKHTYLTRRRAL